MSILEELGNSKTWHEFLSYKIEKFHLSKRDGAFLKDFVEGEHYKSAANNILKQDSCFPIPEKRFLNKHGKGKKRAVYTFPERENMVLKLISYLLYRYDNFQPGNCYSFRRNYGAKKAIFTIVNLKDIEKKYSCKLDIKDYFNSIDVELLLPILYRLLHNDRPLYCFFEKLLTADKSLFNEEVITEKRGAMAGMPVSQFFANVYLAEMDRFFLNEGIIYARYSDDIIVFADSYEMLMKHLETVKGFLSKYRLEINPEKIRMTGPSEKWDFLGISYNKGRIELSPATLKKIKGKIRRKARSIYRWKIRKNAGDQKAMRVFSGAVNRKFFGKKSDSEFTWARWFFPLLSTNDDLKIIDEHVQAYMRYVKSGCFKKTNYRVRYAELKNCGYISLVNMYHRYREAKNGMVNSR